MDGASNKHLQRQNAKTNMDEQTIKAIMEALSMGQRVELSPSKDGGVAVRIVFRKDLKL